MVGHAEHDGRRAPQLPAPTDHLDWDPERLEDLRNVGNWLILPLQADHYERVPRVPCHHLSDLAGHVASSAAHSIDWRAQGCTFRAMAGER
jgi:hypothetical protein